VLGTLLNAGCVAGLGSGFYCGNRTTARAETERPRAEPPRHEDLTAVRRYPTVGIAKLHAVARGHEVQYRRGPEVQRPRGPALRISSPTTVGQSAAAAGCVDLVRGMLCSKEVGVGVGVGGQGCRDTGMQRCRDAGMQGSQAGSNLTTSLTSVVNISTHKEQASTFLRRLTTGNCKPSSVPAPPPRPPLLLLGTTPHPRLLSMHGFRGHPAAAARTDARWVHEASLIGSSGRLESPAPNQLDLRPPRPKALGGALAVVV
jgi:hypothetical protein